MSLGTIQAKKDGGEAIYMKTHNGSYVVTYDLDLEHTLDPDQSGDHCAKTMEEQ